MKFRYFEGPESEMSGLLDVPIVCKFCGATERCFELSDGSGVGCYACLRAGRFGFFHTTEAGYVDEAGVHADYADDDELQRVFVVSPSGEAREAADFHPVLPKRPVVSAEAVYELWRTPDFPTWNEVDWPVHCQEFMTYLGEWRGSDFESRNQFIEMTHPHYHVLWPEYEEAPEWGITYHAFRCPVCQVYRGIVDFS